MLQPGGSHAANTEKRCDIASCYKDAPSASDAFPAPTGSSRTFYKRELPCPPATAFSSKQGMHNCLKHWCCFTDIWCKMGALAVMVVCAPSLSFTLTPWRHTSHAGKQLFAEAFAAGTMEGFFKLVEHFRTQDEPAFCGLASLAMALNALAGPRATCAACDMLSSQGISPFTHRKGSDG